MSSPAQPATVERSYPVAVNTGIEWTDHTGGPWLICTEVSPGCAHCYARELMLRRLAPIIRKAYRAAGFADWETRPVWGKDAPRVKSKGFWKEAYALDRAAAREGVRRKMFPSLIDWLDDMPAGIIDQDGAWLDKNEVLADFLEVISATPNLDWLLLTKRPQHWRSRLKAVRSLCADLDREELHSFTHKWLDRADVLPPANVWIGTTVEDQTRADERIPELLAIPARVRFLSCEPLLGALDLTRWFHLAIHFRQDKLPDGTFGAWYFAGYSKPEPSFYDPACMIDWVIAGGESGTHARPMHPDWARSLRDHCTAAAVSFLFKQWGEWLPISQSDNNDCMPQCGDEERPLHLWPGSHFPGINANGDCVRVGKKRAGRELDGREWNEFPNLKPSLCPL